MAEALRHAGLESSNLVRARQRGARRSGEYLRSAGDTALPQAHPAKEGPNPPHPRSNITPAPPPPSAPSPLFPQIVGVDFTKSNQWTGRRTFGGRSLHWLDPEGQVRNPYVMGMEVIGKVLAEYDDDNLIPAFGFGDSTTLDRSVFPFFPDRPSRGLDEVLMRYKELAPRVVMAGPTNFAPVIDAACAIVAQTRMYHILIIIADGQVTSTKHTEAAIVRASELPLSIILVGVGDGPWDQMDEFDDGLPERRFDNFQFVNLTKVAMENSRNPDVAFAIAALMEVPEQFLAIRKLGYIG